jgi:xylan 1,4-beta-xylosidase
MAAALILGSLLAAAAASPSFSVDLTTRVSDPLNQPLLDCVGSGHGSLITRADYQEHLAAVQRDIGFKHIRGHGLFDDDMSTYLGGKPNLYNLFRGFDFYQSVAIRPIFELSFMPEALASDPTKTIMHYKGGTSPPKDPAKWAALVAGVVQGCVDRYGLDEVRSWRFEVWNEPNGCGFFCPASGNYQEEYFAFYNTTATAVRSVDSLLSVGGPATAGLAWVSDFLSALGGPTCPTLSLPRSLSPPLTLY